MKKILVLLATVVCSFSILANSQSNAYQEGIKTARQAQYNQQQWAQGKGDPKMVKAYQEGIKAAQQALYNLQQQTKS